MTITVEPDVIELPEEELDDVDPDDLEYEDTPAVPTTHPDWSV